MNIVERIIKKTKKELCLHTQHKQIKRNFSKKKSNLQNFPLKKYPLNNHQSKQKLLIENISF